MATKLSRKDQDPELRISDPRTRIQKKYFLFHNTGQHNI
jgi:hypothetical protein